MYVCSIWMGYSDGSDNQKRIGYPKPVLIFRSSVEKMDYKGKMNKEGFSSFFHQKTCFI